MARRGGRQKAVKRESADLGFDTNGVDLHQLNSGT